MNISPPGALGAFPPIKGKRSSPLCTAVRSCDAARGFASQPLPSAQRRLGSSRCRTLRGSDLHFVPLGPPREGERPGCVGASNDRLCWKSVHNITQHCITPRINDGDPKERRQVGKGISRSKVLSAAGYTTRRYVKLLRQSLVGPFSVCPARKVQLRIGVVLVRGWYPAGSIGAGSGNLLPPALPLWTKKLSTSAALPWATSLSSLPCWVVPPAKASSPAGRASSLLLSPLQGTASPCYTWPLCLHTSAGVNPARFNNQSSLSNLTKK